MPKKTEFRIKIKHISRKYEISDQTFYGLRNKNRAINVSYARNLKALEELNRLLKYVVLDLSFDNQVLKDLLKKLIRPKAK